MKPEILETHEHVFELSNSFPVLARKASFREYKKELVFRGSILSAGLVLAILNEYFFNDIFILKLIGIAFIAFSILGLVNALWTIAQDYRSKVFNEVMRSRATSELNEMLKPLNELYKGRNGHILFEDFGRDIITQFFIANPWLNYLDEKQAKKPIKDLNKAGTGSALNIDDSTYWAFIPTFESPTKYVLTVKKYIDVKEKDSAK